MNEDKKYLECEKFWVFLLLIYVAGFYGAYTLVARGQVFCNGQTGNIALFGVALGQGDWERALYYTVPMSGYLLGSMVSEIMPRHVRQLHIRWDTLLIGIEILAVVVMGFIPATAPHQICQIIINFISAMQYNTFRQAEGVGMATTFCTNHIRMFGTNLVRALFHRERYPDSAKKALGHGVMMLGFILGALTGSLLCGLFSVHAVFFTLIPLAVLLADLLRADLTVEKDLLEVPPSGH